MDATSHSLAATMCMYDMMHEGSLAHSQSKTDARPVPDIHCGCQKCHALRQSIPHDARWVLKECRGPPSTLKGDCIWSHNIPIAGTHVGRPTHIKYSNHTKGPWLRSSCPKCTRCNSELFTNRSNNACSRCYLGQKTDTLTVHGDYHVVPYFAPQLADCSVCNKTVLYRRGLVHKRADLSSVQCAHMVCPQLETLTFLRSVFAEPFEDVLFAPDSRDLIAPLVTRTKVVTVYSRVINLVLCFVDAPAKYRLYVLACCDYLGIRCALIDPGVTREMQLMTLYSAGAFPEQAAKKVHLRLTMLMS